MIQTMKTAINILVLILNKQFQLQAIKLKHRQTDAGGCINGKHTFQTMMSQIQKLIHKPDFQLKRSLTFHLQKTRDTSKSKETPKIRAAAKE